MIEAKRTGTPFDKDVEARRRSYLPRILHNVLLATGVTILLTGIGMGIPWIFRIPLPGGGVIHRISDMQNSYTHNSLLLLFPAVEFIATFLIVTAAGKALALLAYLRVARKTGERYHKLYVPYVQPQPDVSQIILGVTGAGKTTMLHVYMHSAAQQRWAILRGQARVPVYIPMKIYNLFLKLLKMHSWAGETNTVESDSGERDASADELTEEITLLDFLYQRDLPGLVHLRPYLRQLMAQGRLLLLCDGLDEIDSPYRDTVCAELVYLVRSTNNRLLLTCRPIDYNAHARLKQLIDDGQLSCTEIQPLQHEQIREFVELSIQEREANTQLRHTAGQIMEMIDHSRLRYHCTNSMMLSALMEIIDKIGVQRGRQIDTRGLLLREFVSHLIEREQKQPLWSRNRQHEVAPRFIEGARFIEGSPLAGILSGGQVTRFSSGTRRGAVITFLGEVACAARWAGERSALQLPVSSVEGRTDRNVLAEALSTWLDEHPPQGPFGTGTVLQREPYDREELILLLQFAENTGLIDISADGVLSFRHELIAEYLVAEYLCALDNRQQSSFLEQLLADAVHWSEPVAFWAGLLDDPESLAERLAVFGLNNPPYLLDALSLSLICIGVSWTPPQAERHQPIELPSSVEKALAITIRDADAREQLARVFTRCAGEGGQEIYNSLFPLLAVDGIDELLVLLDEEIVPAMLFNQLTAVVNDATYETQVNRLIQLLGQLGDISVTHAAELSQPAPGRSLRLRTAAIIILGRSNTQRAVEPLIARLSDFDPLIRERAIKALVRLDPELVIDRIIQELENYSPTSFTRYIHFAALTILEYFLIQRKTSRETMELQRQRALEAILSVLSSHYAVETQQQAVELLVHYASTASEDSSREKAQEMLIQSLSSADETMRRNAVQVLQEVGHAATPMLLAELERQPSETVRMHIVEVFARMSIPDPQALPFILPMLADPSLGVQQQVASALRVYAPDSIPDLIKMLLFDTSEVAATRAVQILCDIGTATIEPVLQALQEVVPGRTRLLVYVLERVRDQRAVPALIALLEKPETDSLLAVSIVHVLKQYPYERVVSALMNILANPDVLLQEEAVNALSQLGDVALDKLVVALDGEEETPTTTRIRRVLLGMVPFPGERLIDMLTLVSEAQAWQIMEVLLARGSDAAQMLVTHLAHPDQRVQEYMRHTLTRMEGHIAVPALLEVLHRPALRPVVDELLRVYPQEAIPQLVSLLGESERGDASATILSAFGPEVLPALVSGLDDPGDVAQGHARSIILHLLRQMPEILPRVVQLFSLAPSQRAREGLLDLLTKDLPGPAGSPLVDMLVPTLLEGLEDARLIAGVSEALVRLAHKQDAYSDAVLSGLFAALRINERREGAKIALGNAGVQAIPGVMNLLTDTDQVVAYAAQQILREMRAAALPYIWAACSDLSNPARREAALKTFASMPTMEIKDGLIGYLAGDELQDISMGLGLLLERISEEAALSSRQDQGMIRALLEYVLTQDEEGVAQRISASLLLVGGSDVASHIAWGLYHYADYPNHRERLVRMLLLLGEEAEETLLEMLRYRDTPAELLAEVVSVLGMMTPRQEVFEYARTIGNPGSSMYQAGVTYPERQEIALRALGGLLAGGHLNSSTLQRRQTSSLYGSTEHELYSILLGKPYGPLITRLENELRAAQYAHEKDRRELAIHMSLLERAKEELEEEYRELEERNLQLEAMNRRLVESNQRLQQRLLEPRDDLK